MRWSLRNKLLAALLLPALLTALVAAISLRGLGEVTRSYESLTEGSEQGLVQALRLKEAITEQGRAMTAYVATLETSNRLDFEAAAQQIDEALSWLKESARTPEAQEMVRRVEEAYGEYYEEAARIISLTWIAPEDVRGTVAGLRSLREPLTDALGTYVAFQEKQAQDVYASVREQSGTVRAILLAVSALAVLVSVAAALLLSRAITLPILTVARAAEELAAGNLKSGELTIRSQDEVGALAAAFNRMAQDLRQLIAGIARTTEAVLTTASELATASEQSAQAAQNAAQEIASMARGTGEQARSAEAASRRVAQLQETLQQIADGASRSAAEVQQAAELLARAVAAVDRMAEDADTMAASADQVTAAARSGAEAVERTMDGMVRIRTAVEATANSIAQLERLSAQIGEITTTISAIADQTNLLALNAAIEAARAGENGRGFAVVADEVRKLAEQTSASAQEISGLIQTIQAQTAQAVESMRTSAAEVASGHATALQAGQQLREILTMVERSIGDIQRVAHAAREVKAGAPRVAAAFDSVSALSEENTAATEEIAAGAKEVTDGVTAIAGIAQANAASAQQLSASIQQLSAASAQVAFSAQELETAARDLQERVSVFKL